MPMPIQDNSITKETLQALCDGDHAAFERVFLFYFNKVKSFINGFVKSSSDAEELAQDVFVNLWANRRVIDPDRNFNTYVYVSARNATINFLRKKYVRDSFVADQIKVSEEGISSAEDLVMANEVNLLVDMTLLKMPAQRKTIYELNRREGLSNEEIAHRLNLSKKTVENHMSLALGEIRNVVKTFVFIMF
jgi:RNA polymerase sigma-70 factor (ECF subfamily)